MVTKLRDVVIEVRGVVEAVNTASTEIAAGDIDLSEQRQALPAEAVHAGQELVRIAQRPRKVTAQFSSGRPETGDLLIGADDDHGHGAMKRAPLRGQKESPRGGGPAGEISGRTALKLNAAV